MAGKRLSEKGKSKITSIEYNNNNNNNNNNVYSVLGPVWREPEPSQANGIALIRWILGKFLRVVCHCFPPPLDVLTFAPDASTSSTTREILAAKCGTLGDRWPVILLTIHAVRDLLHAANLRHGTDGFTSPPKEGALKIFSPLKIRPFWTRELGC